MDTPNPETPSALFPLRRGRCVDGTAIWRESHFTECFDSLSTTFTALHLIRFWLIAEYFAVVCLFGFSAMEELQAQHRQEKKDLQGMDVCCGDSM